MKTKPRPKISSFKDPNANAISQTEWYFTNFHTYLTSQTFLFSAFESHQLFVKLDWRHGILIPCSLFLYNMNKILYLIYLILKWYFYFYFQNLKVTNFSSSWNDGMAFCALVHYYFPEAFEWSELDPKNRRYNFDLAFRSAE